MRLTRFTDYSLRVLIYLAAEPGRRATIAEIAGAFAVNVNHLTKVVHFLGRQGWLATLRGKGGGVGLAQAPQAIRVGEVVRRAEGADQTAECFDRATNTCAIARICRLHDVLQEAADAFHAVLDRTTLADLVSNRRALARVLFVAAPVASPAPAASTTAAIRALTRGAARASTPPQPTTGRR